MQKVTDKEPHRSLHVWTKLANGKFKCVICGGISKTPTDYVECERYEGLTNEERRMCPPKDGIDRSYMLPKEEQQPERKGKKK